MYICSAIVEYYFVLNTIYCIQCIKRDSLMYMYNYIIYIYIYGNFGLVYRSGYICLSVTTDTLYFLASI